MEQSRVLQQQLQEENAQSKKKATTKRERASWKQRIVLERVFQLNPYPNQETRSQLADQLGMSPRKVQIWFQNRRTKAKASPKEDPNQLLQVLAQGVDEVQVNYQQETTGNTLLLVATAMDHSAIQILLSKGADCNKANNLGWTPLYTAVVYGHKHLVELFLAKRNRCDVNIAERKHGLTPLHLACLKGIESISWVLLSKSEDININALDYQKRTPLHHACIYGYTEIVRQLLVKKADINMASADGITPLHCASLRGYKEIVEMLLRAGANVNAIDKLGYSPLMFAVQEQQNAIIEILLYSGANVNAKTANGTTALHITAARTNYFILTTLIQCGADVEAMNNNRQRPIDIAQVYQNRTAGEFLYNRMLNQKGAQQQYRI